MCLRMPLRAACADRHHFRKHGLGEVSTGAPLAEGPGTLGLDGGSTVGDRHGTTFVPTPTTVAAASDDASSAPSEIASLTPASPLVAPASTAIFKHGENGLQSAADEIAIPAIADAMNFRRRARMATRSGSISDPTLLAGGANDGSREGGSDSAMFGSISSPSSIVMSVPHRCSRRGAQRTLRRHESERRSRLATSPITSSRGACPRSPHQRAP